jgi:predicted acyltransferase
LSAASPRLVSLDVLRGMTIFLMIIVNMSIDETLSWPQLLHARWHGFTLTDLVFPTFLFATGAALSLTLPGLKALPAGTFLARVGRRAAVIVLLGFYVSNAPFFRISETDAFSLIGPDHWRWLGVLQRIGMAYGLAAVILRFGGERAALVFSFAALGLYSLALTAFGDLTLAGNAPLKLDLMLFGADHLYHGEGRPFDPEGVLGLAPATVNLLAGYGAARFLKARSGEGALQGLIGAAAVLIIAGVALDPVMPINKKLWTASYVLLTIGLDLVGLALLSVLYDGKPGRPGARFFSTLGKNPLAVYVAAETAMALLWTLRIGDESAFMAIYHGFFAHAGARPGSFLFALVMALGAWALAEWMDRRGLYLKA